VARQRGGKHELCKWIVPARSVLARRARGSFVRFTSRREGGEGAEHRAAERGDIGHGNGTSSPSYLLGGSRLSRDARARSAAGIPNVETPASALVNGPENDALYRLMAN